MIGTDNECQAMPHQALQWCHCQLRYSPYGHGCPSSWQCLNTSNTLHTASIECTYDCYIRVHYFALTSALGDGQPDPQHKHIVCVQRSCSTVMTVECIMLTFNAPTHCGAVALKFSRVYAATNSHILRVLQNAIVLRPCWTASVNNMLISTIGLLRL